MNTVLVVDDSKTARLTLKRKLETLNYQVEMADSGEAALEYLNHNSQPDLIFMDVLMGAMSGYEAARQITQNPTTANMPIVMCTSKDSAEDRAEAAQNGAQGFIIKPISDEELGLVLKELITEKPTATAAPSHIQAPSPTETPVSMPSEAFVIPPQLESMVRRWIEESNTHVAEAVAQKVIHGSLSQHLGQVEDLLEGKLSILSSSLAALHSAQEKAQAEYQVAQRAIIETKPHDHVSEDALRDMETRINDRIEQQLQNWGTQEQSRISAQEQKLEQEHEQQKAQLEQTMQAMAEKAAASSAEQILSNVLGSHLALMDERIHTIAHELATVKEATKSTQPDNASELMMESIAERVALRVMEVQAERLLNAAIAAQQSSSSATPSSDEHLAEKLATLKSEIHAELIAALPEPTQQAVDSAPLSMPEPIPETWLRDVLANQEQFIEQRLQQWSTDLDERLAQHKEQLLERVEHASAWMNDQLGIIGKRQELPEYSENRQADVVFADNVDATLAPTIPAMIPHAESAEPMRVARMALAVAAVAVVLGLIALFVG
jgi:CheY-like chemotaxis protein